MKWCWWQPSSIAGGAPAGPGRGLSKADTPTSGRRPLKYTGGMAVTNWRLGAEVSAYGRAHGGGPRAPAPLDPQPSAHGSLRRRLPHLSLARRAGKGRGRPRGLRRRPALSFRTVHGCGVLALPPGRGTKCGATGGMGRGAPPAPRSPGTTAGGPDRRPLRDGDHQRVASPRMLAGSARPGGHAHHEPGRYRPRPRQAPRASRSLPAPRRLSPAVCAWIRCDRACW